MIKIRFLIAAVLTATISAASVTPAAAAPWVRGFVIDNYEPAFRYGGRSGTEEPGSDCPKGTIQILDYKKVLKTAWRRFGLRCIDAREIHSSEAA